jgi:hypothetical protein
MAECNNWRRAERASHTIYYLICDQKNRNKKWKRNFLSQKLKIAEKEWTSREIVGPCSKKLKIENRFISQAAPLIENRKWDVKIKGLKVRLANIDPLILFDGQWYN